VSVVRQQPSMPLPTEFGALVHPSSTVSVTRVSTQMAARYQRTLIRDALADLRKAYAKHIRWLIAVQDHLVADEPEPPRSWLPGKDAKHRMYGHAGRLIGLCGWNRNEVRPSTLGDLGMLIARVEQILAGVA
jgi:hypothetical protein